MKLSACMIVQDEEECIHRALNSIHPVPVVEEIILVDGGSIDKTKKIAMCYEKVKLFDIPFANNFAVQKNNAIEKASGDWILFLDADEYYDDYTVASFARLIEDGDYDAFAFSRKTFIDGYLYNIYDPDYQVRLFRDYCRYEGQLHEGVTGFKKLCKCNLDIKHYKKAEWQQKDDELYWDLGQEPPPWWKKIDGKWVHVDVSGGPVSQTTDNATTSG